MTKHWWYAAVTAAVLSLAGCGDSGHEYPAEIEMNFLNACTASGGERPYCGCVFDKLEKKFSAKEYLDAETALTAGKPPEEFMEFMGKAQAQCMAAN